MSDASTTAKEAKPSTAERVLSLLGKWWFWFSQITSIVGLISIIDDLRLWVAAIGRVIAYLRDQAPVLAQMLLTVGGWIHAVLEVFRGIARPLFDFLLGWLPFEVPQIAKDAFVVAMFLALGLLRVTNLQKQEESSYKREQIERRNAQLRNVAQTAKEFGIEVEIDANRGVVRSRDSLSAFRRARPKKWSDVIGSHDRNEEEEERELLSRKAENASPSQIGVDEVAKIHASYVRREHRARLVWVAAALTASLVVADWYFMH